MDINLHTKVSFSEKKLHEWIVLLALSLLKNVSAISNFYFISILLNFIFFDKKYIAKNYVRSRMLIIKFHVRGPIKLVPLQQIFVKMHLCG